MTSVVSPAVKASAQCATGGTPQVYEIALVLDTTGSMNNSAGTQSKMQAAQQAASDFVGFVFATPSFAAGTRIAIVPFAAAVAVDPVAYRYASWIDKTGASKYHWNNIEHPGSGFTSRFDIFDQMKLTNATWGWNGCLESLGYPQNTQDGYATASDSLYVPMFAPDEDGTGTNGSYNSYLNDYKSSGNPLFDLLFPTNCPQNSIAGYGDDSQARSCKYKYASGAAVKYSSGTSLANGPGYMCTSKPLQRLTTSIGTLKALIASLASQGSTNIFEGVMWGWRTLSPISVFGDGGSYAGATKKVLVLMTDGTNTWNTDTSYNKSSYSALGYIRNADGTSPNSRLPSTNQNLTDDTSTRNALDALTAQACTNAKAAGVTIYTVAFSTPGDPIDTIGVSLLANCASSATVQPSGSKAFVANDAVALKAAFSSIGTSIGKIRLSQ